MGYILGSFLISFGLVMLYKHLHYVKEGMFTDINDESKTITIYVRGLWSERFKIVQTITDKKPRLFYTHKRVYALKFVNECMYEDKPSEEIVVLLKKIDELIEKFEKRDRL